MKAIVTKYLPATNTKPSRIRAIAEGVKPVTVLYDYDLSGEAVFKAAAVKLAETYSWSTDLVGGGLPDQSGYVFCFRVQ